MNLDQEDKKPVATEKEPEKKKLSRKEKKALKKTGKTSEEPSKSPETTSAPAAAPDPKPAQPSSSAQKQKKPSEHEEVEAQLDPSPIPVIPPPKYTMWEKISPPARRKKQISSMESGFREVLGLVHSMRNNQEVLLEAFKKLPEAVDSVKKLADHSAQQSDLLKAMNDHMGTGSAGEFNKTLSSMDQTTKLLLERAQRSEEQLYSMLRRAQRRIAFMTLLVLLLFLGAVAAGMAIFFPEKTRNLFGDYREESAPQTETVVPPVPPQVTDPENENSSLPDDTLIVPENDSSPIDQPTENVLPTENPGVITPSLDSGPVSQPLPDTQAADPVTETDAEGINTEENNTGGAGSETTQPGDGLEPEITAGDDI